jgi:RHS repeat-associated protein
MPYIDGPDDRPHEVLETGVKTTCAYTYLWNSTLPWWDVSGHLTTLTHDISGANLIRRDVGGAAAATEHYTQPPADFGGLLAQYTTASAVPRYYYPDLPDNIGVMTNGYTASDEHIFQAFGQVVSTSTPPTTQPYGFGGNAGYYTDPISGLQIAWDRVYDANVGQWASRDPIGYEGGDWESIYRYVANNPVMWRDAWGLGPTMDLLQVPAEETIVHAGPVTIDLDKLAKCFKGELKNDWREPFDKCFEQILEDLPEIFDDCTIEGGEAGPEGYAACLATKMAISCAEGAGPVIAADILRCIEEAISFGAGRPKRKRTPGPRTYPKIPPKYWPSKTGPYPFPKIFDGCPEVPSGQ